jgi:hypothetical protein
VGPHSPSVRFLSCLRLAAALLLSLLLLSAGRISAQDARADHAERPQDVVKPLRGLAFEFRASSLGAGAELAIPVSRKVNLRAGVNLLSLTGSYNRSGIDLGGKANLKSGTASLDLFPFHGGFHISPGVAYRLQTSITGTATVPGGQTFYLGGVPYTSSASDPVTGTGSLLMGNHKIVPQVTMGWGNMLPRSGRHISFPVEFGVQYFGTPTVLLSLQGSACQQVSHAGQTATVCAPIGSDPAAQANVQAEIQQLDQRMANMHYYPIGSIGVAYRF